MKKIQINEFKVNAQQMQVINQIAERAKTTCGGWMQQEWEKQPDLVFGVGIYLNKAQYDALMSILNQM